MGAFGQTPSAISTPRRTPSKRRASKKTSPRWFLSLTQSPSPMPVRAASDGMDHHLGPALLAPADVGVSVKVEFRNCARGSSPGGTDARRVASSMTAQWSGSVGISAQGPIGPSLRVRHLRPVRLEAELAVRIAEPVEEMRLLETAAARRYGPAARGPRSCPSRNSAASSR